MAELLSPAGNFEKLRTAVLYGADAVYLAGRRFGMRAAADNFSPEELREAAEYAHARGVRLYVAVNVMPRTSEYPELEAYVRFLAEAGADAVIVSDVGVLALVREAAPQLEIHISTQASAVSAAACRMWHALGAKRVVLARELSMAEIREIRANVPDSLELEAFVHGSMCIAYSGRCLLSNYYTGRDGNRGACAQPCRWNYSAAPLTLDFAEEKRPGDVLGAEEYADGTVILSSKDTCMIEHIPDLMESGVDSFKIEGRMKSAYYAAVVTNAYRMAMDVYAADPAGYTYNPLWMNELCSVSHRAYATGFYYGSPAEDANTVSETGYIREKAYIATAVTARDARGYATFLQRNKVSTGDAVALLSPGRTGRAFTADSILDENNHILESAPHPAMLFQVKVPFDVRPGDILRS